MDGEDIWGDVFEADAGGGDGLVDDVEPAVCFDEDGPADFMKWENWIRGIPLPSHLTPDCPTVFGDVSDEDLLNAPPHLIVHLQRTGAQHGLQVVSPRQTPITYLMDRVNEGNRQLSDHVVGSVAMKGNVWPTVDGRDLDVYLPDEPLPTYDGEMPIRERTKSEPLTKASHLMRDPVLACLLKGRAVIDILRRDDVCGGADAMTQLLANAWGVPTSHLMDMDAFTLAIDGPLQRHAMRTDDVYPVVYAPIHRKRCVRVGGVDIDKDMLPTDSAMDWRRMRIFCEAVFLLSCSIEGIPLHAVRCVPPPGDPAAPLSRANILAFRPAPCTAWSFEPRTFSILPVGVPDVRRHDEIPLEVMAALSKYVETVRPVSHALVIGHEAVARKCSTRDVVMAEGETLKTSYRMIVQSIVVKAARGKGSSRAVRDAIFSAVSQSDISVRLRLTRYMSIAKSEVAKHLGDKEVPDRMVDNMATRFLTVGGDIRRKLVAEATRRGHTVEDWWHNITAMAPTRYGSMTEGTMGWAKIGMYLIFKQPLDKWGGLQKKLAFDALRDAQISAVGGIPLPPKKGSPERVLAACREVAKNMSRMYFGYYTAVSDVAHSLAAELDVRGRGRSADIMREASYLWILRARALRGANVSLLGKGEVPTSENHTVLEVAGFRILVAPAPYRAYEAYKSHVRTSEILPKTMKKVIADYKGSRISGVFSMLQCPLIPVADSVVTRYVVNPRAMAEDLERSWGDMMQDMKRAAWYYGLAEVDTQESEGFSCKADKKRLVEEEVSMMAIPTKIQKVGAVARTEDMPGSYYTFIQFMELDEVEWFEDRFDEMEPELAEDMSRREFENIVAMRDAFIEFRNSIRMALELESVR